MAISDLLGPNLPQGTKVNVTIGGNQPLNPSAPKSNTPGGGMALGVNPPTTKAPLTRTPITNTPDTTPTPPPPAPTVGGTTTPPPEGPPSPLGPDKTVTLPNIPESDPPNPKCPDDFHWDDLANKCILNHPGESCPPGYQFIASRNGCFIIEGTVEDIFGPIEEGCPQDFYWNASAKRCVVGPLGGGPCPEGYYMVEDGSCKKRTVTPEEDKGDPEDYIHENDCEDAGFFWTRDQNGQNARCTTEEDMQKKCTSEGFPGFDSATGECSEFSQRELCEQKGGTFNPMTQKCDNAAPATEEECTTKGGTWDGTKCTIAGANSCTGTQIWDSVAKRCIDAPGGGADVPGTTTPWGSNENLWNWLNPSWEESVEKDWWDAQEQMLNRIWDEGWTDVEAQMAAEGAFYGSERGELQADYNAEMNMAKNQAFAEMRNDALDRHLQRQKMALDYTLGDKQIEMDFAIKNGQLTLDQFRGAMEAQLGFANIDILAQQLGIKRQELEIATFRALTERAAAEATNDLEWANVWSNFMTIAIQLGMSEAEAQAFVDGLMSKYQPSALA